MIYELKKNNQPFLDFVTVREISSWNGYIPKSRNYELISNIFHAAIIFPTLLEEIISN